MWATAFVIAFRQLSEAEQKTTRLTGGYGCLEFVRDNGEQAYAVLRSMRAICIAWPERLPWRGYTDKPGNSLRINPLLQLRAAWPACQP